MIIGVLLAGSIVVFFASVLTITISLIGSNQENLFTGAVLGSKGAVSYSIIALVISVVLIFFLILVLKKPSEQMQKLVPLDTMKRGSF